MSLILSSGHLVHKSARLSGDMRRRHLAVWAVGMSAILGLLAAEILVFPETGLVSLWFYLTAASLTLPLAALIQLRLFGDLAVARRRLLVGLAIHLLFVAALTGGLSSPFTPWLLCLPIQAFLWKEQGLFRVTSTVTAGVVALLLLPTIGDWQIVLLSQRVQLIALGFSLSSALAYIVVSIGLNLAQRVDDEANAKTAESQFRYLAENSVDLITRHGRDSVVEYISPSISDLLGYKPGDCQNRSWIDFVHPEDVLEVESAISRARYFGGDAVVEYRLAHADGGWRWVDSRCRPVLSFEASRLRPTPTTLPVDAGFDIVMVTRDVQARKTHELTVQRDLEEAQSANQAKSRFIANMSHELRTPLNAIIGFSEMITTRMFGPIGSEKYSEYAQLIHDSGHHLLNLINDILDLSKVEAGKFKLDLKPIDIHALSAEAMGLVKVAADRAKVRVSAVLDGDLPDMMGDRRALKQILLNLLSNAIKFTPEGGAVAIRAAVDERYYYLQVVDNGIGISEEDLARLGRPFEQVEDDQVKSNIGTGLGLALVKSFAALHGGEAEITSRKGEGTWVTIILPRDVAETDSNVETLHVTPAASESVIDPAAAHLKGAA